ncbi:MAG: tachylectin-related carbohydrate-binding protein [Rhodospirillales bacterium]
MRAILQLTCAVPFRLCRAAFVLAVLVFAFMAPPGTAWSACGGDGQSVCTTAKATKSSTKPWCPTGSQLNLNFKCYSCPTGYGRTLNPDPNAGAACERSAYTVYKKPVYRGAVKCKKPVIIKSIGCATWDQYCSSGEFPHGGKSCYSCDGYNRNGNPIDSAKGCDKVVPAAHSAATFKGNLGCGSLHFDAVDGGSCWSCPNGYDRNFNSVKSTAACTARLRCDSGNVEIANKCYKKGKCGGLNDRPCLIVERLPSCDEGLYESAKAGKCLKVPPGQSPWTATLGELADVGKDAKAACLKTLGDGIERGQAQNTGPSRVGGVVGQCRDFAQVGFACSVPTILDLFAVFNASGEGDIGKLLEKEFTTRMTAPPCGLITNPDPFWQTVGRASCGAGFMIVPPEIYNTSVCITKLSMNPQFRQLAGMRLAPGRPMCTVIGETLFDVAKMYLIGKLVAKAKGKAKAGLQNLQAKGVRNSIMKGGKFHKQQMEALAKASVGIDRLFKVIDFGGNVVTFNTALQIMNKVPECGVDYKAPPLSTPVSASSKVYGSEAVVAPGTLYVVDAKGQLKYYRHMAGGTFTIGGKVIGTGWSGFKFLRAAALPDGGGALYAVTANGDLMYYEHDANGNWKIAGKKIGTGWAGVTHFMVARQGELYIVRPNGELQAFRHNAAFQWTLAGKVIGTGWAFPQVFSGGHNAFYVVKPDSKLYYYYHDEQYRWVHANMEIGQGWGPQQLKHMQSGGNGELYAVKTGSDDDLLFYRHDANKRWVAGTGKPIGTGWGDPGKYGLIVGQR